jgi:hypothetical protein
MAILKKLFYKILPWFSNIFILLGTYLTAIDSYPVNKLTMIIGTIGWFAVGVFWKKAEIWLINLFMTLFLLYGLMF